MVRTVSPRSAALVVGVTLLAGVVAGPAAAVKRRAFVTSTAGSALIADWTESGGLHAQAGADAICQARAADGGRPNPTAYRAWLSTAATDAYCHVQGMTGKKSSGCVGTPQPAGPWYQANGLTPFTGTLDELTGPERVIYTPVRYNEHGVALDAASNRYWSGTRSTGEVASENCASWVVESSGSLGGVGHGYHSGAGTWTNYGPSACNFPRHLLCLETGASETPVIAWQPAALIFVTSVYGDGDLRAWPQATATGSGLAAGDSICRNLAAAARLPAPESFVAWLSAGAVDAADRLTLSAAPYRRVDHVRVAPDKAGLVDGTIESSIHVDEHGSYGANGTGVYTGTDGFGAGNGLDCDGWTDASAAFDAGTGNLAAAFDDAWTDASDLACEQAARLYCVSNVVTVFWDGFERTGDTGRWSGP